MDPPASSSATAATIVHPPSASDPIDLIDALPGACDHRGPAHHSRRFNALHDVVLLAALVCC